MAAVNIRYLVKARAGIDAGDGVNYFILPGSCNDKAFEFAKGSNVGVSGKWVFRVDGNLNDPTPTPTTTISCPTIAELQPIHAKMSSSQTMIEGENHWLKCTVEGVPDANITIRKQPNREKLAQVFEKFYLGIIRRNKCFWSHYSFLISIR